MPINPSADLAAALAARLGLTLGSAVFAGPVRPVGQGVPARAVFVQVYGGPRSTPYRETPAPHIHRRTPRAQIRVRSEQHDHAGGEALAWAALGAVDLQPPTGYQEARCIESAPLYIAQDRQGLHEWAINVELVAEDGADQLFGNATSARFDGLNDYIYVPDHADLRLTSALTFSCWMRLDAALPSRTLASKWAFATDGGWALQTGLNDAQARRLVLYLATAPNSNLAACNIQTGNVWEPETWHHIAWTFDTGTVAIYVDGVSVAWTLVQGSIPSALLASTAELRFGAWSGTLARHYGPGNIDEIALYARALSGAEIAALAVDGRPADLSEIPSWTDAVGWWRFDGDAHPTIRDWREGDGAATIPHPATMANMAPASLVPEVP